MPVITQEKTADPREHVLAVNFMRVGRLHYIDYIDYPDLAIDDYIIVHSRSLGKQMGQIKGFVRLDELSKNDSVYTMLRPATPADLLSNQQWKEVEVEALIDCREKAAQHKAYRDVKFVNAEYNYNGSVLTFYYSSEEMVRIPSGPLRSALGRKYNMRLEFRYAGPRDVAKLQEGFGACGIPRCCSTFLTDFSMVSITMAKAQGISLNPSEITGMCGRLRCCLTYEYEQYVQARKQLPRVRKRVGTVYGEGRVVEQHPLQDAVSVRVDEETYLIAREDLKPLDELEALQRAAGEPCKKNDSGGCDCGAKRPRGSTEDLMQEMGIDSSDSAPDAQPSEQKPQSKRKRSSRRGSPRHDSNRAQHSQDNENQSSSGKSRRRRNKRRRRGGNRSSDRSDRRDNDPS